MYVLCVCFMFLAIFACLCDNMESLKCKSCHLGLDYWNLCFYRSLLLYGLTRRQVPRFQQRRGGGERELLSKRLPDTHCLLIQLIRVLLKSLCVCVCVCAWLLSCVQLFVTPWTVAHHAFSRQKY